MSVCSALRFNTLSHAVACDSVSESQNVFGLNSPRHPDMAPDPRVRLAHPFPTSIVKQLYKTGVASATAFDITESAPPRQGRAARTFTSPSTPTTATSSWANPKQRRLLRPTTRTRIRRIIKYLHRASLPGRRGRQRGPRNQVPLFLRRRLGRSSTPWAV
jgi:hypothetical protein